MFNAIYKLCNLCFLLVFSLPPLVRKHDLLSPLDKPVRGSHVQAGRRTSGGGGPPLPEREPDLEGGRGRVGIACEAAESVAVVAALEEDVKDAAVEAAGFDLGLLYHVTSDHVQKTLRDGQTPLEDVDPGGGARGSLEQPRKLRLELMQPPMDFLRGRARIGGRLALVQSPPLRSR